MKCEYCGRDDQREKECEWCGAPIYEGFTRQLFGLPVVVSDVLESDEIIVTTDWHRWVKTKGTGQSKS